MDPFYELDMYKPICYVTLEWVCCCACIHANRHELRTSSATYSVDSLGRAEYMESYGECDACNLHKPAQEHIDKAVKIARQFEFRKP